MPFAEAAAEEAPEADPNWDWIWQAWHRLGAGDRPRIVRGMSVPMGGTLIQSEPDFIPWTAVDRWATRYGLSQDDAVLLDRCVQALDGVYRQWWLERNKPPDG